MSTRPLTATERAQVAVEHTVGCLLDEVRAERASLGLPAAFEFVCLVHSHSVAWERGAEFVDAFIAGQPLALAHGSPLALARSREELYRILLTLYERGEGDASYVDYSRPDATLLHIHHPRGRWVA